MREGCRRVVFVRVLVAASLLSLLACEKKVESDLQRGDRLFVSHLYLEAFEAYQSAATKEPGNSSIDRKLNATFAALGGRAAAIAGLEKARDSAPADSGPRLALAQLYLVAGRTDQAMNEANAVLKRYPNSQTAQGLLGAVYLARNEPAKAVATFREIVTKSPKDAKARYQLGVSLLADGKSDAALTEFESALTLSPTYFDALSQIETVLAGSNRTAMAVERVRKQIAAVGDSVALKQLLAIAYSTNGQLDSAETTFLDVIARAPQFIAPYVRLSELYRDTGKLDKALSTLDRAIKIDPENPDLWLVQGTAYEAKGDRKGARRAYETALSFRFDFAAARNNLAMLLAESGTDLDSALHVATVVRESDVGNPIYADTFGWVLYKRGEYDKAIPALREALEKLPNEPTVAYHLGAAQAAKGDVADAKISLNRALASTATFPERAAAQKALASLK